MTHLETLGTPVIISLLEPQFAFIDGQFLYTDRVTGKIIPNHVMTEYDKLQDIEVGEEGGRDDR